MAEGVNRYGKVVYWENIGFLILTHLLAGVAIYYSWAYVFSWKTIALAVVWYYCCSLSISAGYHRLFAHRSYKCSNIVRFFHLAFGAASWQSSALNWASDHRDHHAYTDDEGDPYNIKKGFWWAHWGWLCYRPTHSDFNHAKDLKDSRLVSFQDRHYFSWALLFGILLPMLIAWTWQDAVGAFLWVGWFRLLIQYHATFSINSVAHWVGTQPYSTATSARDSLTAAVLTMGEGYHNYHHRFPSDYRNGIRFYHWDPSKWAIWCWSKMGLAWDLKQIPDEAIEKAKEAVKQGQAEKIEAVV